MKNLLRAGAVALAFALSCLAGPAFAQTANCASYDAAGTCLSGVVLWDPIAKAPYKAAGGSGAGDASAANQNSQINLETAIQNRIGDAVANPASNTLADRLKTIGTLLTNGITVNIAAAQAVGVTGNVATTLADGASITIGNKADPKSTATDTTPASVIALLKGQIDRLQAMITAFNSPFQAGGSIGNSFFGARLQDASGTAFGTSGNPVFTASSTSTIAAPGSTAPSYAQQVGGVGPSGNLRAVSVSTSGGLLPGQATTTSTRTTITASTITTIDIARAARLLLTIQLDGSPNAAIYLCFNGQSATCSATVYDIKVASGAADASVYTAPFGMTGIIYAFTTGTGNVVNVSSWLAQ